MKIFHKEKEEIYIEATGHLIKIIDSKIIKGGKTLLLLSGGSSVNLYSFLAEYLCHAELVSASKLLALAQIDERFQPGKKDQISKIKDQKHKSKIKNNINADIIRDTGLWSVCKSRKIPYYLVSQDGTLRRAADEYNQIIKKLCKEYFYKLAVLGIGEDCHTAGLIPGYEKEWNIDSYVAGYNLPQGKFGQRITVTPKLLKQLDYALIVAKGAKKTEAIENALKKENLQNLNIYPAAIIQKIHQLDLFTDI